MESVQRYRGVEIVGADKKQDGVRQGERNRSSSSRGSRGVARSSTDTGADWLVAVSCSSRSHTGSSSRSLRVRPDSL